MAEVVDLKTRAPLPPPPASENVVSILEDLLAQAKEGRFVSVAVAAVCGDGSVATTFDETKELPALLGAVAILQHRLVTDRVQT